MGKAAFIGGFFYHCDKTSFILLIVRFSEMMIWRYRNFRADLWSENITVILNFILVSHTGFPDCPKHDWNA